MITATLRKVGGSVMVTLPSSVLTNLHLKEGNKVTIDTEGNSIVIAAVEKKKPTRAELFAKCDFSLPPHPDDAAWLASGPVGGELL